MNDEDNMFLMDDDTESLKVLQSWGLQPRTVERLLYCGIAKIVHLKLMKSSDIDVVFNEDTRLGEKILFRECLSMWKEHNGITSMPQETMSMNCLDLTHGESPKYSPQNSMESRTLTPIPVSLHPALGIFNLRELLRNTMKGIKLLSSYEKDHSLTSSEQLYLCHVIVDFHMASRQKMTSNEMAYYAREIVKLFPTENESTYFMRRTGVGGKKPQGKLYYRYANTVFKFKKDAEKRRESSPSDFG
ncbi:uncharacterized protein LOC132266011 [Phlebotomus argentipes]|uniref:uncharacterized protein LOC132266011 n=1 Tax=Phlebotomus argentipes TaxID=94469 RepID=UPI002892CA78|nr:uncharacterized protein LOC132266011 [Phlebotomus argentipes]